MPTFLRKESLPYACFYNFEFSPLLIEKIKKSNVNKIFKIISPTHYVICLCSQTLQISILKKMKSHAGSEERKFYYRFSFPNSC